MSAMDLDTEVDLRLYLMRYPEDARVCYEPTVGYWLAVKNSYGYVHIDLPEEIGRKVLDVIAPKYL